MTKILLVEDDKSLREIYGVRLLAEGYDIVSAGDGEEALALAIKERPQLIISDVMMPKISGFDMLDILRSTTETRTIKVIMMTALSSDDQRRRGEQLGADRYLVKSQVGIEDVVRTVHEVLGDAPVSQPANQNPFDGAKAPTPVATPSQPTAPAAPAPAPQPAPQPQAAPYQTAPTNQAPAQPQPSTMPQPTAPFSSSAPRPANLGERVIQPLDKPETNGPDVSELIDRELSGDPMPFSTELTNETHADAPAPNHELNQAHAPSHGTTGQFEMPSPSQPPAPAPEQTPEPAPTPQPEQQAPAQTPPAAPAMPQPNPPSGAIQYEETPIQTPPAAPQMPTPNPSQPSPSPQAPASPQPPTTPGS